MRIQGVDVKKVVDRKYLGSTVQSNFKCGKRGKEVELLLGIDQDGQDQE